MNKSEVSSKGSILNQNHGSINSLILLNKNLYYNSVVNRQETNSTCLLFTRPRGIEQKQTLLDLDSKLVLLSCVTEDKPWFDDQCRHAFGLKQEACLQWTSDHSLINWEEFDCCQVRANETYLEAKCQFRFFSRPL